MKDKLLEYLIATDSMDEFLGKKKIIKNKIQCKYCGDILESIDIYDKKKCSCGRVGIDGGHDYLKRIGREEDYIELSEVR